MPLLFPTTCRAENEKRRPPLATAAERLTLTSDSDRSWTSSTSMPSRNRMWGFMLLWLSKGGSELEAAGAGRIGQRLDTTVEAREAAVEHDLVHALLLGLLRDLRADDPGLLRLRLALELGSQRLGGAGRVHEGLPRGVVDDLRA